MDSTFWSITLKFTPAPILPQIPAAEFANLKSSIQEHGVLVPVMVTHRGVIIDGNERYRAWLDLGLKTQIPWRVLKLTEAERIQYAVRINLERRHLTAAEPKRLLMTYLTADPTVSSRTAAAALGVDRRTASKARTKLIQVGQIAPPATVQGRDGKVYPPRPAASSAESIHGARLIAKMMEQLPGGELEGGVSPRKLKKQVFDSARASYSQGAAKTTPNDYKLHLGDFRKVASKIADDSIDFGFTDPPWSQTYNHLLAPLFEQYTRILKPGSLVATYVGVRQQPAMMDAARKAGLEFWWSIACLNKDHHASTEYSGMVRRMHRQVLIFKKPGKTRPGTKWLEDVINAPEMEKKVWHEWQQPLWESVKLLQGLARPGWLCADLCTGSGTTAVACLQEGLRWVGCEIDPATHKIASRRISDALKTRVKVGTPIGVGAKV
jgi:hypothetical protein